MFRAPKIIIFVLLKFTFNFQKSQLSRKEFKYVWKSFGSSETIIVSTAV